MNAKETVALTRLVAAVCPQQAIDDYTPDAWFDLLGDLAFDDCRAAVAEVGKHRPFIAPADIRAEVRRIRAERIARAVIPAPDPELVNDPAAYKAALNASVRLAAEGRLPAAEPAAAIAGPPLPGRRNGPPMALAQVLTEARARLTPRRRALADPQQLAAEQAAEARAAREAAEAGEPS